MSASNKKKMIKSGYMLKRGKVVTSWKTRYFKLYSNGTLEYFQYKNSMTPNGSIDFLNALNIVKKKMNEIEIITSNRTWNIKTESEFTRNKWFESIFMIFKGINVENIPKQIDINKINDMLKKNKQQNEDHIDNDNDNMMEEKQEKEQNSNKPVQGFIFHRISMGETLVSLSVKYGISMNKIKCYNKSIFDNRLSHISGKIILIPTCSISANLDHSDLCSIPTEQQHDKKKEVKEPNDIEKDHKRKALRYYANDLDQFRCDYYLKRSHWNVRKAMDLWKMDDIWEKQQKSIKSKKSIKSSFNSLIPRAKKYNDDDVEESVMGSREHSISSYFEHIEFDQDGFFRVKYDGLNDIEQETEEREEREQSLSSSLINDEFIRFHFEHIHQESIEEHRNFDKMTEEYEQRQIYEEMIRNEEEKQIKQQNVNALDAEYGVKYQYLCQQYQFSATQNQNNLELIQQQFHTQMDELSNQYLKEKEMINNDVINDEIIDLRQMNLDRIPEHIASQT